MSDRSSAEIFGTLFEMVDKHLTGDTREMFASALWNMSRGYDFADYQMCCDDSLVSLGLARLGIDKHYPADGEVVLYGPNDAD